MHLLVVSIFIWIQERQDFLVIYLSDWPIICLLLVSLIVTFMCIQEVETTPAYPDICFAVDDFDSTFDSVVRFSIMILLHTSLFIFDSTLSLSLMSRHFH